VVWITHSFYPNINTFFGHSMKNKNWSEKMGVIYPLYGEPNRLWISPKPIIKPLAHDHVLESIRQF
jgi:hypothetical protein